MRTPVAGCLEGHRILVVEDSPELLDVCAVILEFAGAEVFRAVSAEAALEILAARAVSLVVTDVNMPGMSGIELTSTIAPTGVPVLVMSAGNERVLTAQSLEAGAVAYLPKPFGVARFTAACAGALGHAA